MERARIAAGLALPVALWMAFDGARALIVGDYVTPSSGEHAGSLGPWATLLSALGIAPRATAVKALFVVYGTSLLVVCALRWWRPERFRQVFLVTTSLGLWYLPFGTLLCAAALAVGWRKPTDTRGAQEAT